MSSNIVMFPRGKKSSPPDSVEELYDNMTRTRIEQVSMILDEIHSFVFDISCENGFDIYDDEYDSLKALAMESLGALLLKTVDVHHPLSDFADELFGDEEETVNDNS